MKGVSSYTMLKRILILPVLAVAAMLPAADWSGWRDESNSGKVVWGNGFDDGAKSPYTVGCYSIAPHGGLTNSGALCLTRTNPADYFFQEITLKNVRPGELYQLRFHVRGENLSRWNIMSFAGLEFKDAQDKWITGNYIGGEAGNNEFRRYTLDFSIPANAKKTNLILFMTRGITGKLFFDNVEIVSKGYHLCAIPMAPSTALGIRSSGEAYRFQIDPAAPAGLEAVVSITQNGMTTDQQMKPDEKRQISGRWPQLVPGPVNVTINVVDPVKKIRMGETSYTFQRTDDVPAPKSACLVDDRGRAVVNGEFFMPLGVFVYAGIQPEDMKRLRDAGFNCVLDYGTLRNTEPETRAYLDQLWQYGLKSIFSLKDQATPSKWKMQQWEGAKGGLSVAAKVAASFRNHPGLLAWYVCDEAIRLHVPLIQELRQALSAADPYHPTYVLTNMWSNFPYYGVSGDIAGVDPYPIKYNVPGAQSIREVVTAMKAASLGSQPVWLTVQAFNNGIYGGPAWNAETMKKTRAPSREEMRAMTLLGAIYGAKGFLFYSYTDTVTRYEKALVGSSAPEWEKLIHVAKEMKRLEPFLMNAQPAPVALSANEDHTVHCRTFRLPDGQVRVLIVADSGPAHAIFKLDDSVKLVSRFGLTRQLPDGRYEFRSQQVDSDILESAPTDRH